MTNRVIAVITVVLSLLVSHQSSAQSSTGTVTYVPPPMLLQNTLNNYSIIQLHPGLLAKINLIDSLYLQTQQTVENGVRVRLYRSAIDKALAALPSIIGPVIQESNLSHVFATGSDSYWFCDFAYELGVKHGNFRADLAPERTRLSLRTQPGNAIGGDFDIDVTGSATPYVTVNLCDIWSPSVDPTLSASRLYGVVDLTVSLVNNQLTVLNADFRGGIGELSIDLGPITWFLDLVGLRDNFENWLRDIANEQVSALIASRLPSGLTEALRDRLNFSDTVEGFNFAVKPQSLETSWNGLTLGVTTTLSPETPVQCAGPALNCIEPNWADGVGKPLDSYAGADAAASVSLSVMNQAMFAVWRSGKLAFDDEFDAQEIIGAIIPGLPVQGTAKVKVWTERAPVVALPDFATAPTETDPNAEIGAVVVNIKVPETPDSAELDVTLRTELAAKAILEITPPYLGAANNSLPNPNGNQIQFRLTDFGIGTTTATFGPGSAELTQGERDKLLNDLVLPMYREKVGTVPLSSSIIDFNIPNTNRRAALKVLAKTRQQDSIVAYVRFDVSPANDTVGPTVSVDTVNGVAIPVSREVLVSSNEATVTYSAEDNFADYLDYVTFETSLNAQSWVSRNYVRALKLTELPEGLTQFNVRGRDFANNPSANSSSVRVVVDTLPPSTSIVSAPDGFTNQQSVTVRYSATDAGSGVASYSVFVDDADFGIVTTATARTLHGLTEGPHSVTVRARDRANHRDEVGARAQFTVDLTPPMTSITGVRTGFTKPAGARFQLLGTDNFTAPQAVAFAAKLEGPSCAGDFGEFTTSDTLDLTGCDLTDGEYTVTVKSRDLAGNEEAQPAKRSFVVDATPPALQIMNQPATRSTDLNAQFLVAASDNLTPPEDITYVYRVVGLFEDFSAPVTDPFIDVAGLPSGDYVFEVSATDFADNQSPIVSHAFSVDNRAPVTELASAVPAWVTAQSFEVNAIGSDDRTQAGDLLYSVSINGGLPVSMRSPLVFDDLSEGQHTARISAVDNFGNIDPVGVTASFTVDRTEPETVLDTVPSRVTTGSYRPLVSGTDNLTASDELRYSYRITRENSEPSEWSAPVTAGNLAVELREIGFMKLEIAAIDNAGLIDSTPVELSANVAQAGGCACSSSQTTPDEALSVLALAAAVLFLRRRLLRA